jgi:2-dehydropantoate 2-reductase
LPTPSQTDATNASARIAVMGAGAVGSYFGGMLARAGGRVTLIARQAHVEAIRRAGLLLDSASFHEHVSVAATSDPSGVRDAEFVLFCVKTTDTEEAARAIAPHLAPGAIVVSLQNGVDNVARIRASTGVDALPAVVYVATALPEPGHVKHSGRGDLIVGELPGSAAALSSGPARAERVAQLFMAAGVPCRVSPNIDGDLWTKFIMNCAGNPVTAIAQTSYGLAARQPQSRELMRKVIEEIAAVARASGVRLPEVDLVEMGLKLAETLGDATSSTAQDLARGKRTEIDSLNGYIVRRGEELGVATPLNSTLYALIKLIEEKNAQQALAQPAGLAFTRGRLEFPLGKRLNRVQVELRIKAPNDLNAVDRAILTDNGVENDFSVDVCIDRCWGILRIHFLHRYRAR